MGWLTDSRRLQLTLAVEFVSGAGHDNHHAPCILIPGAREPGLRTTFEAPAPSMRMPAGSSTMDAATIAERQREGGGALSQRRPPRERWRWKGLGRTLHQLLMTTRAVSGWRFRTNHVKTDHTR